MIEYLYGLLSIIGYSFLVALGFSIIYFVAEQIFKLLKLDSWILKSLITTYIVAFFVLLIVFFAPAIFGVELEYFKLLSGFWDYVKTIFFIILHILYINLYFTVIAQPFVLFGAFIYEKFNNLNKFLRIYISLYIISFVFLSLVMFFPWLLGGLVLMIYF